MSVSVLIPAYDSAWCIERCLLSVAAQTTLPDRVMIGVDSCTDTLAAVHAAIPPALTDRTTVYYFARHAGCYRIRNTLAVLADTKMIAFFDADDEMTKDYIAEVMAQYKPGAIVRPVMENIGDPTITEIIAFAHILTARADFIRLCGFEPWECAADSEFHQRWQQGGGTEIRMDSNAHAHVIRHVHPRSLTKRTDTGMDSDRRREYRAEIIRRRTDPVNLTAIAVAACEEVAADRASEIVSDWKCRNMPTIIVPMPMPDDAERAGLWRVCRAWWDRHMPDCRIVEAPGEIGPNGYWKSRIFNAAFRGVRSDIVVMADADIIPPGVEQMRAAIAAVIAGDVDFVVPHRSVARVSEADTARVLASGSGVIGMSWARPPYSPTIGGGLWVATRAIIEAVDGFDEAISGWGAEDDLLGATLVRRNARIASGWGDLLHLWHEPAPRQNAGTNYQIAVDKGAVIRGATVGKPPTTKPPSASPGPAQNSPGPHRPLRRGDRL